MAHRDNCRKRKKKRREGRGGEDGRGEEEGALQEHPERARLGYMCKTRLSLHERNQESFGRGWGRDDGGVGQGWGGETEQKSAFRLPCGGRPHTPLETHMFS